MSSDVDEYGIMEGLETRIGMANKEACEKVSGVT
jgi:hypothetical protein